jgi:hypothetical protein
LVHFLTLLLLLSLYWNIYTILCVNKLNNSILIFDREPGSDESTRVCTPMNGGHGTLASPFNGYKETGADPNKEYGIIIPEGYKGGFYPVPSPLPLLGKGAGMPLGHDHTAMMKSQDQGQGMRRVVRRS